MGRKIKFLILILLTVTTIQAQEKSLSFKKVDSTTYSLYLKQDWKSLLEFGEISLENGIDFYYLQVRMGIAYYKEGKMLSAIKMFENAYTINKHDLVVQEYLYWSYYYSGMILESRLFYIKLSQPIKDKINLKLPKINAVDFEFLATTNVDYDALLQSDANLSGSDYRYFTNNYQSFSVGLNHPLSNSLNLYHRLSVLPVAAVKQENSENIAFSGTETRYYADMTFSLGNRLYVDTYLNFIFGSFKEQALNQFQGGGGNFGQSNTSNSFTYFNYIIGGSITKVSYYVSNKFNISISNLNDYNQIQGGYTASFYPFSNASFIPFGSIQFVSESINSISNSRMVYTGGATFNTDYISVKAYGNIGEINNFNSNNGSIIYNQVETVLSELGVVLKFYTDKMIIKLGYSYMEMEATNFSEEGLILQNKYNFNQQNIIGGITWKL